VDKLLAKLQKLLSSMDVGVPRSMIVSDLLGAANLAAARVGGTRLNSLEDEAAVARTVRALERSA